ncbi:MAG: hypothetical protein ACI9M9_000738 [Flavobacteriaceae bacterium]|jgi:hypothetical protein
MALHIIQISMLDFNLNEFSETMITTNRYKLITLVFSILALASCVQDNAFDTPSLEVEQANITGTEITMRALNHLLIQEQANNENSLLTFDEADDSYIAGYVISSDQSGNYFEEIIFQDKPSSPTIGLKILIDENPLYITYEFGRKVYAKLAGLTVGLDSGVLTLGIRDGNGLGKISAAQMTNYLVRENEVAEIAPLPITISEFTDAKTSLYVSLTDVQFNRNEVLGINRLTFAGEKGDLFDGERTLEDCSNNITAVFSTSTFADFKGVLLPDGRGTLVGILTKNFFGDAYNMVVNDPSAISFDSTDRCDPNEIDCGLAASTGSIVLFNDFFETQTINQPILGNGWTNFIEAGTETWEAYSESGTNASLGISVRMGSFSSGDESSVGWLITPQIDFDEQEGETLKFKTSNSFSDGSTLELWISQDWDGQEATIISSTWALLPAAYIVQDDDNFGNWAASGNVDLSCIKGAAHIAWKYVGSGDKAYDGTYELDEIEIESN